MTTMRRVVGRCGAGYLKVVLSFAGAVLPMTTTRLPTLVRFMAAPVRATADEHSPRSVRLAT
jgi:hypothetical protein